MKVFATSTLVSIAALGAGSLAAVTMNIAKNPSPSLKLSRRFLSSRDSFSETLGNQLNSIVDANYIINVTVGTPPQVISLAVDTGSSDVWVLDSSGDICTGSSQQSGLACVTPFNSEKSSSFTVTHANKFDTVFDDQSSASGDYFTDVLNLGEVSIKAQTMGLGSKSTLSPGLLGIGYDLLEASEELRNSFVYPSLIDSLVAQGTIATKAYSLYLDDLDASTGIILFGGLDSDKFHGNLVQLPILVDESSGVIDTFTVASTSYAVSFGPGNSSTVTPSGYTVPVILDSGTTLSFLPDDLVTSIFNQIGAVVEASSGNAFVDCAIRDDHPELTFDFGFGGPQGIVIQVPVAEFVFDASDFTGGAKPNVPISNPCALGFASQASPPFTLGDNFLRSAYVVYDLKNNLIAIGQTNFDSTTSSILDFSADATAIPSVSGVASGSIENPAPGSPAAQASATTTTVLGTTTTTAPVATSTLTTLVAASTSTGPQEIPTTKSVTTSSDAPITLSKSTSGFGGNPITSLGDTSTTTGLAGETPAPSSTSPTQTGASAPATSVSSTPQPSNSDSAGVASVTIGFGCVAVMAVSMSFSVFGALIVI